MENFKMKIDVDNLSNARQGAVSASNPSANSPYNAFSAVFMPNGQPAPAILTADEAAAFLRLDGNGERTLKYWRDTNQLQGVRLGKKVRYPLSELLEFTSRKLNQK
jgi:hypothetical protein